MVCCFYVLYLGDDAIIEYKNDKENYCLFIK